MNEDITGKRPSVLVMMACYNGSKYICEQIDSILNQQDVDVTLRICDDRSKDETADICHAYANDNKNVHFSINAVNKGLAKNFMDMVMSEEAEGYDYYAFSDQDDVWLPDKLIHAIIKLRDEATEGPALYYSDIENVNSDLSGGSKEFWAWKKCANELIAVLSVNWASGCTMVFNPELRSWILGYEPNSYPRNHDGWLHLAAMVSGTVIADLGNSYIKRRLSGENQVGHRDLEKTESISNLVGHWKRIFSNSDHCQTVAASYFLRGYGEKISQDDLQLIQTFASMPHSARKRLKIAERLFACPFPTRSMACSIALKALMNRL